MLSGGPEPRAGKDSWWHLLDGRLEVDATLRAQVEDVDESALPPPADPLPPSEDDSGCAIGQVGAKQDGALVALIGALMLVGARRRRRST